MVVVVVLRCIVATATAAVFKLPVHQRNDVIPIDAAMVVIPMDVQHSN